VPLQESLVLHPIVHAQLDKLMLMTFVMLVDINVTHVKKQLLHVHSVFLNQTEQKFLMKPTLVNVKLDSMMMDTVHIVMLV